MSVFIATIVKFHFVALARCSFLSPEVKEHTRVGQNNWNNLNFTSMFQRSLELRILIQILVLQFIVIADGAFYLFYCIFLTFFQILTKSKLKSAT